MNSKRSISRVLFNFFNLALILALLIGSAAFPTRVGADTTYSKTDLGTSGGDYDEARTINNAGQIAGYSNVTGNTSQHGFVADFIPPTPDILTDTSTPTFTPTATPMCPIVPAFTWAGRWGGTSFDQSRSITVDGSGNVYTTGHFQGLADFDPGAGTFNLTSAGNTDVFISKLDGNGDFVWAVRWGGTSADSSASIFVDGSGNVYTTGSFRGTADFDPGAGTFNLTSSGVAPDVFVSKLDNSGNFVWTRQWGGTSGEDASSIHVDGSGNVYTSGYFYGTVDFDPGAGAFNLTSAGTFDPFVSKLDSSGNFLWAMRWGGLGDDAGRSITVDGLGDVYITGTFSGTVDFDPSAGIFNLSSAGAYDLFVSKLDSSGNFVWARRWGGTSNDYGWRIFADGLGDIYTTGAFEGTVDFDPGAGTLNLTSAGGLDVFVSKLDSSGDFIWAKQWGGTGSDQGNSIFVDGSGDIYTAGQFSFTTDFDPGAGTLNLTSAGSTDAFVSKLDSSGGFVWAVQWGGTGFDSSFSIFVDGSGDAYTTGLFEGTVDFDPGSGTFNLSSAGGNDIFVSKFSQGCAPTPPNVSMSSSAPDTTNTSPIAVTVQFTADVTGFADTDIVTGNGTVSNFLAVDGDIYTFDLTPIGQGLVTADITAGVAQDSYGNPNNPAPQFSRTFDTLAPDVTINQAAGQADPTTTSPILFDVIFSEAVTDFDDAADVDLSASTVPGALSAAITPIDAQNYTISVSGITGSGTVVASIPANVATDTASNGNTTSTSTDNIVNFTANQAPMASAGGPYNGDEGSAIAMSGATASELDISDTLTYTWSVYSPLCSFDDASLLNPNLTCSDNGSFDVTLEVSDGIETVSSDINMTVDNVAPSASLSNNGPINEGGSATVSFSGAADPSSDDTTAGFHYAFDCNGGSLSAATYASSGTSDSTNCTFANEGSYSVSGKVMDTDDGSNEYTTTVTVNHVPVVAVILLDSEGNGLAGATAQYYSGGWQSIPGSTDADGELSYDGLGLSGNVTFRISYANASIQKQQNITDDPEVIFQTQLVSMQLLASDGSTELNGDAQYYSNGWRTFGSGSTSASMELLPLNYTFRLSYGGASIQKQQNIANDPAVIFQTKLASMQLLASDGTTELVGTGEYYANGWKTFGSGSTSATMELLPVNYTFRVSYGGASIQKQQNVTSDPAVLFQTKLVTMKLLASDNTTELPGTGQYYANGWKNFSSGSTTTSMELLPVNHTFRVSYGGASVQKAQDVNVNQLVVFQTGQVHSNSASATQYYANGWKAFTQDLELLPGSYAFKFNDGTPQTTYPLSAGIVNSIH